MEERIENATSDWLIQPDWRLNLEIIQAVDPSNCELVMEVLQRKLLDPNRQVQMLALSLTEGLMNGSYLMMSLFNTAPFHNTLRQLADDTRTHYTVKDKLLTLVRAWGEALERDREFASFWATLQYMRNRGYPFPKKTADTPPFVPPRGCAARQTVLEHVGPQHAQAPPVPQAIASRASAPRGGAPDVEEIISNGINSVILLLDVCYQTNPHHEDIQDNDLVRELLPQCRSVQARVRKVLESEQIYMAGSESLLHVALQFNDEMCRLDEALESLARGVAPKRPLPQQEDIPPELLRQLANEHGQQHQVPSRRTPDDFEDAPALSLDRQTRRPSSSAHAMPPSSSLIAAAAPVAQPQQHQHHVEQEQHQQPPTPNEFDLGIVLVPQPPKATRKRSTSTKTPSNDLLSPRDSASPRVLQPVAAAPPTAAPATPKAPATPSLPSDDPFMALASRLTTSPPSASASAPTPFGSSVPPTATAAAPTPSTMSLLAGIPFTQPQPQPQPAAMAPVMMQPMMAAQAMTPQQYQYALQQQQQYQMMLQRQQQQQQQQQQQRQSPAGTGAPWPSGSR